MHHGRLRFKLPIKIWKTTGAVKTALPNTLGEWENPRNLPLFLFETEVPKTSQWHSKPGEEKPFQQKLIILDILRRHRAVRSSFYWLQSGKTLSVFSVFRKKGKIAWDLRQEAADSNLSPFSGKNDRFFSILASSKHRFCAPRPDLQKNACNS